MQCRGLFTDLLIPIIHNTRKNTQRGKDKRMTFLWNGSLCLEIYKFRRNESNPILYIYLLRMLTICLTNLFIYWNNIEKNVILILNIYFCDRIITIP